MTQSLSFLNCGKGIVKEKWRAWGRTNKATDSQQRF